MLNLLKSLYMLPGTLTLWWTYQNPSGGIAGVAKSGRNYRSPAFTFLTATGFWFTCGYLVAESDFEIESSKASGPLVKPGSSYSSAVSSSGSAASNTSSPASNGDTACEKAKKSAARAESLDELQLAKAKVEALC